jgi:hypothetical protein
MAGKGAFFLRTTIDPSGKAKPERLTVDSIDQRDAGDHDGNPTENVGLVLQKPQ